MKIVLSFLFTLFVLNSWSQGHDNPENINKNKFRQLKQELPTPNVYRTASGAPGHEYYQQRANYNIKIELDDEKQTIHGEERESAHKPHFYSNITHIKQINFI